MESSEAEREMQAQTSLCIEMQFVSLLRSRPITTHRIAQTPPGSHLSKQPPHRKLIKWPVRLPSRWGGSRSEKLTAMGVTQDASVFKEVNPAAKMAEERALHDAKLAKMENEMKLVFQQKVAEKEAKLKQSEEELYARHREMREALDKQRLELEDKKRRLESGRPLTPEGKGGYAAGSKKKGFSLRN